MNNPVKRLAILGSTGSIGKQTLDIVRAQPERYRIVGLAGGNNIDLLTEQVGEFMPDVAGCSFNDRSWLSGTGCEFVLPENIAALPDVDIVVMAISGTAGINPTLSAVKAGKTVALANKESLVAAGEIITAEAARSGAVILPVDSEHSAIWQCLNGETQKARRIILTASGGPFRGRSLEQMAEVTVQQALDHPSWQMGKKVTIDSATLMNKGLEVIEARWLFDVAVDNIKILVHPQSIIHSMVEFIDGSVKAQLGCPDMRLPIQYALSYPDRIDNPQLPRIDWDSIGNLLLEQPDFQTFPCLGLAIEAGRNGGTYPAVLCAADEAAVDLFLSSRLRLIDIANLVGKVLEEHEKIDHPTIDEILVADTWARNRVREIVDGGS